MGLPEGIKVEPSITLWRIREILQISLYYNAACYWHEIKVFYVLVQNCHDSQQQCIWQQGYCKHAEGTLATGELPQHWRLLLRKQSQKLGYWNRVSGKVGKDATTTLEVTTLHHYDYYCSKQRVLQCHSYLPTASFSLMAHTAPLSMLIAKKTMI